MVEEEGESDGKIILGSWEAFADSTKCAAATRCEAPSLFMMSHHHDGSIPLNHLPPPSCTNVKIQIPLCASLWSSEFSGEFWSSEPVLEFSCDDDEPPLPGF